MGWEHGARYILLLQLISDLSGYPSSLPSWQIVWTATEQTGAHLVLLCNTGAKFIAAE